eukprot:TRINITY_DN6500_c0_g1_i3.p1 TRINITY_DN6500_c0_g1~~TRINITY_DN6500_c0_g1_i3.p1  ORF type:complete len:178 (-),score=39.59 TRINITY_DN6500_c0_g1_i3:230-691(-)
MCIRDRRRGQAGEDEDDDVEGIQAEFKDDGDEGDGFTLDLKAQAEKYAVVSDEDASRGMEDARFDNTPGDGNKRQPPMSDEHLGSDNDQVEGDEGKEDEDENVEGAPLTGRGNNSYAARVGDAVSPAGDSEATVQQSNRHYDSRKFLSLTSSC